MFIYLGDLCPLRGAFSTPSVAAEFVEYHIFSYFKRVHAAHKFVMCGNTDFGPCIERWTHKYRSQDDGFQFVRDAAYSVGDFNCIFLSTTEASTHALKDCEALGACSPRLAKEYVFSGNGSGEFVTKNGLRYGPEFVKFERLEDIPSHYMAEFGYTILDRLCGMWDAGRPNILFSHAPPLGYCDLTPMHHAGSADVL